MCTTQIEIERAIVRLVASGGYDTTSDIIYDSFHNYSSEDLREAVHSLLRQGVLEKKGEHNYLCVTKSQEELRDWVFERYKGLLSKLAAY